MIVNIIWYLKRIYRKITGSGSKDTWQFRDYLYKELIDLYGKEYFNTKNVCLACIAKKIKMICRVAIMKKI